MRFCSLGSGSGGNATVVEASQGITRTRLLIDAGFSQRELTRRLASRGLAPAELDAIFITHEHGDHIGCAAGFAQRHRIPLWASAGTWQALSKAQPDFPSELRHVARAGEAIPLGDLCLQPYGVPHDAKEPLQLRCHDGAQHLGVLTDAGSISPGMHAALSGCHALLLECNHDVQMLQSNSRYPASLKRRILGSHGHLSNAQAAELLRACAHAGLQQVVAAHLSESNNLPELVLAELLDARGTQAFEILVADQAQGMDWLLLRDA
ncbi:MBL fold metallo-hydrolase [Paucibacter soli]|uniref:MBL fold metallo-hydrolase n=1 Tax=Paucibacter soli TaxID=3133433 RepID=UPI0030AEA9A5